MGSTAKVLWLLLLLQLSSTLAAPLPACDDVITVISSTDYDDPAGESRNERLGCTPQTTVRSVLLRV